MKKIVVGIVALSLLTVSNAFAYEYTQEDNKTLDNAYTKIDAIFESSPKKIEQLEDIIDSYMPKLDNDSQMYFLLIALKNHIDMLQANFQLEQEKIQLETQSVEEKELQSKVQAEQDSLIKVTDIMGVNTVVYTQGGSTTTARLIGVNHVNSFDEGYDEAISYLKRAILNKEIQIETDTILGNYTSDNEALIYIFIDGENINKEIINSGYAKRNTHGDLDYKYSTDFLIAENNAKEFKRGTWKDYSAPKATPEVKENYSNSNNYNSGSSSKGTTYRTYYTGERGGCYYLNSSGNKTYVDRSFCN